MPTICRLIQLTAEQGAALAARPDGLEETVAAAKRYTDLLLRFEFVDDGSDA